MHITHATAHKWQKAVYEDPFLAFGKNAQARLRSTLKNIDTTSIETRIAPLDHTFLDIFIPIYEARIHEKANPVVFDIREKTLGRPERAHMYYSMLLLEDNVPLGGTVFSVRDDRLSIAYRTYAHAWNTAQLTANPSLYTEYAISKHAYDLGKQRIIHGKDRNPYGLHSNIGLAAFKLSVGCQPMKSKVYELRELDTEALQTDALVLEYPGDTEDKITKAYLVVTKETEPQWTQVTKYPERLVVQIIHRSV